MSVEQSVEWELTGETEVLGENLPQRHFVHHKSRMTRPGLEPRAAAVGSQRLTAWAMVRPSLENSARFDPVFTFLDFAAIFFLQSKGVSFESNPQPGGPNPCNYVP
jgi:hypothetical protein